MINSSKNDEPRNVEGMTRAEFEHHLRICFQYGNVRSQERGGGPKWDGPIGITPEQEREIAERVERSYPSDAYDYTAKVCPGCTAFDSGASEVEFVQGCEGCKARMQKIAGFGPLVNEERAASTPATTAGAMTDAVRDVLAERQRQVTAEGWTPQHDDAYTRRELERAAKCYIDADGTRQWPSSTVWPWHPAWWKPTTVRRNLVKAAALIIAAIERIDRAASSATPSTSAGEVDKPL